MPTPTTLFVTSNSPAGCASTSYGYDSLEEAAEGAARIASRERAPGFAVVSATAKQWDGHFPRVVATFDRHGKRVG